MAITFEWYLGQISNPIIRNYLKRYHDTGTQASIEAAKIALDVDNLMGVRSEQIGNVIVDHLDKLEANILEFNSKRFDEVSKKIDMIVERLGIENNESMLDRL